MTKNKHSREPYLTRHFSSADVRLDRADRPALRLVGEEPAREVSEETKAILDQIFGSEASQ